MRRVRSVAMRFEQRTRRIQCFGWKAQVARCQRHFGLRDHASRTRKWLLRTKSPRSAAQQGLCLHEVPELRHRDAAQRERRWIVAQGYQLQRAERIARG